MILGRSYEDDAEELAEWEAARKRNKALNVLWDSGLIKAADLHTAYNLMTEHHPAGPGTLGHPEGCEYMAPEERAYWEAALARPAMVLGKGAEFHPIKCECFDCYDRRAQAPRGRIIVHDQKRWNEIFVPSYRLSAWCSGYRVFVWLARTAYRSLAHSLRSVIDGHILMTETLLDFAEWMSQPETLLERCAAKHKARLAHERAREELRALMRGEGDVS